MVHIKPQFSGLLSSITVALAVGSVAIDALPHSQRQPHNPTPVLSPIDAEFPDLATRAPLMCRGGGGSGSSRARMMRQLEAAQIFEASRLAHAKMRREQDGGNVPQSSAQGREPHFDIRSFPLSSHNFDSRPTGSTPDNDPIAANSSCTLNLDNDARSEPHKRHHHRHPERPTDTSKGGHSEHWSEHHAHDSDRRHHRDHHGHHDRRSRRGASRIASELDSRSENEFVAPASVRVKSGQGKTKNGVRPGSRPSRVVKKPKSKNHVNSGPDRKGTEDEDAESREEKKHRGSKDRSSYSVRRNTLANPTQGDAMFEPPVFSLDVIDGTPGVVDFVSGPAGEKLGGLSVTSISYSTFATSINETPLHNATTLEYLIDSTPNPAEQTTFYLREFNDQSLIHSAHSSSAPATTQAVQDLLVSLEVPLSAGSNSTETIQRMCATFNPQAQEVQTFGLSLCMDEHGAKNDGTASQAFRFSPDTGVVQPFYGVEGYGDQMLEQMNERIEQMDAEAAAARAGEANTIESNSNEVVPDLVPVVVASSTNMNTTTEDPVSDAVPSASSVNPASLTPTLLLSPSSQVDTTDAEDSHGTAADVPASTTSSPSATDTPTPALSSSAAPNNTLSGDALVIGKLLPSNAGAYTSSQDSGNSGGLVMVFRRVDDGSSKPRARGTAGAATRRKRTTRNRRVLRSATMDARRSVHVQDNSSKSGPGEQAIPEEVSGAPMITPVAMGATIHSPARSLSSNPPSLKSSDSTTPIPDYSSPKLPSAASEDDTEPDSSIESPLSSGDLDNPLPKPRMNVAYFGDSGRSAPVPPEDQAESTHPILVADPGNYPQPSKPAQLATADAPESGVVRVFLMSPKAKSAGSALGMMVTMGEPRGNSAQGDGGSSLPIDASD